MQAYKFDTKVSESGTIFLPYFVPSLHGKEVELFIVPKEEISKKTKEVSAKSFVSRWGGFLKDTNINPDEAKYEYLEHNLLSVYSKMEYTAADGNARHV